MCPLTLTSEKTQAILFPRTLVYFCHSAGNFIFSTDLCRYQNVLKCIPSNIEVDKTTIYMPYSGRLFNSLMNVYISDDHVTSQKP